MVEKGQNDGVQVLNDGVKSCINTFHNLLISSPLTFWKIIHTLHTPRHPLPQNLPRPHQIRHLRILQLLQPFLNPIHQLHKRRINLLPPARAQRRGQAVCERAIRLRAMPVFIGELFFLASLKNDRQVGAWCLSVLHVARIASLPSSAG